MQPAATLPPELAQRASELQANPDVYAFPSRKVTLEGEPTEVNFDRVWGLMSNPLHWEDDSYHNELSHQDPGENDTHQGAWFEMTHQGFPLMPTVWGKQNFVGVIVESKVEGAPGARTGTVVLAELNNSGKAGWQAIPEHLQTLTVTETPEGNIDLELGVETAPSDSPEWLRKGFLRPWATWHIEIDEADKMRHLVHRVFPDQELKPNPVGPSRNLGALVGAGIGVVGSLACGGTLGRAVIGGLTGALVGGGLAYYVAGETLRRNG